MATLPKVRCGHDDTDCNISHATSKTKVAICGPSLTDIGLQGKQIDSLRLQARTLKAPRRRDAC